MTKNYRAGFGIFIACFLIAFGCNRTQPSVTQSATPTTETVVEESTAVVEESTVKAEVLDATNETAAAAEPIKATVDIPG